MGIIINSKTVFNGKAFLGQPIPNPILIDLQSYWKLDETSGTVANDSVGSITGTLESGFFTSDGKLDYGYARTSDGDGISTGQVAYVPIFGSTHTWNVWFKKTIDADTILRTFIVNQDDSSQAIFNFSYQSGKLLVSISNIGLSNNLECHATYTPTLGEWDMFTISYNGNGFTSGVNIYINSIIQGKTITSDDLSSNTVPLKNLWLGSSSAWTESNRLYGVLDEVGIWNRILTQQEVTELYNNGNALAYPF